MYGQEQVIKQDPYWGSYYISKEKYDSLISCKVNPGDLLLSLVGTIGQLLVLPESIEEGIINPRLIKISIHPGISKNYVLFLFKAKSIQRQFKNLASGQTMDVISISILKKIQFPLSPLGEQVAIVERVKALLGHVDELEKEVASRRKLTGELMREVLREAFEGTDA